MLRIGFVCEGPTDTPILEAVVEADPEVMLTTGAPDELAAHFGLAFRFVDIPNPV